METNYMIYLKMIIENTIKEMIHDNKIYYDKESRKIKYCSNMIWD